MCRAGFVIEDVIEPLHADERAPPGTFAHRSRYVAPYLRVKARRACDEQRFKARARASQVPTLFWYRRYRDLTVAAIERNAAIREALARFSAAGDTMPETELDALLQRFSTPTP